MKTGVGAKALRLAVLVSAGLWGHSLLAASVIQVGNCQGKTGMATIQDGVNAVAVGGTVVVCPGIYPEQVTIDKPLTLTGIQVGTADAAVIVPPAGGLTLNTTRLAPFDTGILGTPSEAAQILITATTGNVNLNNLTVDGSGNELLGACPSTPSMIISGIYYRGASGTVTNVATRNQVIDPTEACGEAIAIQAESAGALPSTPVKTNVTIQQSSIRAYQSGLGIGASGFGVHVTIDENTIGPGLITPNSLGNNIQLFGATGSIVANSLFGIGGQEGGGILVFASHGDVITGNVVGYSGGTPIGAVSVDGIGDADDSKITSNVVFANTGTELTIDDAGIVLCSNKNQVLGNEINGSSGVAIYVDTCGNTTFTSTGNTISFNQINEACAGVLLNTAGNTATLNQFQNVFETVADGNTCSAPSPALAPLVTPALAAPIQGRLLGILQRPKL